MSNYGGRKAPNVSQYIAGLNSIPSEQDLVLSGPEDFNGLTDEMDLFINTPFNDFTDMGIIGNLPSEQLSYDAATSADSFGKTDFQFTDFTLPSATGPAPLDIRPAPPSTTTTSPGATSPISLTHVPRVGDKRKSDGMTDLNDTQGMEESSRVAAEEDKRRRNTAASARFRVKKKQREQALEKSAKEMTDKLSMLESKVQQLEMENKWLKGLITDKSDKLDVNDALKQLQGLEKSKHREQRKDGVGTTSS